MADLFAKCRPEAAPGEALILVWHKLAGVEAAAGRSGPPVNTCQIRSLGIQLAIDNFGTGYSSLSYVHRFPVNSLKIDRSFTARMEESGGAADIVGSILPMAEKLRMDVVAEGVETAEQVSLLRQLRCDYAQGYYFSKPTSASDTEALLKSNPLWSNASPPSI